jgi:heme exporter protein A
MGAVSITPAIAVRGLTKWYGGTPALRGLDLTVAPGEICALFGGNGAGKTTLLRILAGRVRPTSGTVAVAGHPLATAPAPARAALGVLAHGHQCYEALTARENLAFAAALLGRPAAPLPAVLAQVGLEAVADARVRTFSAGMKRRLALGKLLLRAPAVLLLDEPYASLDAAAVKLLEEVLLAAKARGATVLLATHNLRRGVRLADRLVLLRQGRLGYEGPREEGSLELVRTLLALEGEEGG